MKVTVLLKNDHEMLRGLFDKFQKPANKNQNGKKEIFNDIRREIEVHSQMEMEIFYPALQATSSTTAAELVSTAVEDHKNVEKLLVELNGMNGSDRTFETGMNALMDSMIEHIDKEEMEIFDEARRTLPEFRLEELGLEMEDRRKVLMQLAA